MSDLVIRPEQKLTEVWEATYERAPWPSRRPLHHTARLWMPDPTQIATHGEGASVNEARIDLLLRVAAGYIAAEDISDEAARIRDETLDVLASAVRREQRRRRSGAATKAQAAANGGDRT